jgi:ketosteroid isomerase-like protein
MTMNELDKKLDAAMGEAMATVTTPQHEPVPLRKSASLAEQMQQLERVERELTTRVRREIVEAQCVAEQKTSTAHTDFNRRLSEETARLERERDELILQVRDEYHAKLSELERLMRRRPAGGL